MLELNYEESDWSIRDSTGRVRSEDFFDSDRRREFGKIGQHSTFRGSLLRLSLVQVESHRRVQIKYIESPIMIGNAPVSI